MSLYDGTGVSCCSASVLSWSRSATAPSMSTSVDSVKCGIVAFDSAIRRAMICWIREGSSTVTSPLPVSPAGAFVGSGSRSSSSAAGCSSASAAGAPRRRLGLALLLLGSGLLLGLGLGRLGLARLRRLLLRGAVLGPGAARRGGLDVGLDDPSARASALERRQVDAVLARDAPRAGRALRPAAVALGGRRGLGLRRRLAVAVAVGFGARGPGSGGLPVGPVLLGLILLGRGRLVAVAVPLALGVGLVVRGLRRRAPAVGGLLVALGARLLPGLLLPATLGRLAAALADPRDHLADGERRALVGDDLERAVRVGLVGHRRLVGLDLDELLALGDLVARRLEPLEDRALLHRVGQARHRDVGHSARCYSAGSGDSPRPGRALPPALQTCAALRPRRARARRAASSPSGRRRPRAGAARTRAARSARVSPGPGR